MENSVRKSPDFLEDSVIYQLFLRAFCKDRSLVSAAGLLPHIAGLGIDIVYLCPVVEHDDDADPASWSPRQKKSKIGNPKNPYRHKDFFKTDNEYGTDTDLKDFIRQAHRAGMRVMLDLVYMHCGPNATFLAEHPDYAQRDERGQIITNAYNFPLINFDSEDLREYLWSNMEYFLREFDADGYRCDTSDCVPLDFWEEGRRRMEQIKPYCIMLAEGHRKDDQQIAFDLNYAFPWKYGILKVLESQSSQTPTLPYLDEHSGERKTARDLRAVWEKMNRDYPAGTRFVRNMDDHDITNDCYDLRHDHTFGVPAVDAALVVNLTLDGVPMLYNGQEIADISRHSIYANNCHAPTLHIDWSRALTSTGQERLQHLKTLIKIRRANPALTRGRVIWLDNNQPDAVLSFVRQCDEQAVTIVVNMSDQPQNIDLVLTKKSIPHKTVLERGAEFTLKHNHLGISLNPYGFLLITS